MIQKILSLILLLIGGFVAQAQYLYPPTKTVDSSDTYFGVTYKDPYRWLENLKENETEDWFKQQSAFADKILDAIPGKDKLVEEFNMLDKLQPPAISGRDFFGGRLFYRKTMPGEAVAKFYYRQGMNGKEILLFDPSTFIEGKQLSISSTIPSFDGKKVLISYQENGAELNTIRVLDVESKSFLPEAIYPSFFGATGWTFDNKAFTYFSQKEENVLNGKAMLHILGTDVKNDIDIFSNESYPELKIAASLIPFAGTNQDSKNYLFADLADNSGKMTAYYADINELYGKINWKPLCTKEDNIVRGREIIGDDVYAITSTNTQNFKLVHTSLKKPDWQNADIIMAEKKDMVLESITHTKSYLIATYSDGINNHLYKYNFKSKQTTKVRLPYSGTVYIYSLDNSTNNCIVKIAGWNKPVTEFGTNLDTEKFVPSTFNKPPVYPDAYINFEVKEVEVKGHDGIMVPLSIIYKKGLPLNGNNVCLMDSYGGYGISMKPFFNPGYAVLASKNVVIAIPHVRGGSEKGEAWRLAGHKTTKPNTWKDFNSCAEYLINEKYTSPKKLAGTGTSAGGILISRAITERPDLYAAAICNVGVANALRNEFLPSGKMNIPETGTVEDSIECKALFEMDGVQHVEEGVNYPAVIGIGGWNDPRVSVWQPGKFIAALQNRASPSNPFLLKINYNSGHFTEDKNETYKNFANQLAFVLWQCGHKDFQPK